METAGNATHWWLIVAVFLLVPEPGIGQVAVTQVSLNEMAPGRSPVISVAPGGRVWVISVVLPGTLEAGRFDQGVWSPQTSVSFWGGIRQDFPFAAVVDEAERIWVSYTDTSAMIQFGFFDRSRWVQVMSLPYLFSTPLPYSVFRNRNGGVWFLSNEQTSYSRSIQGWLTLDSQIVLAKPVVPDPEWPSGNQTSISLRGAVSTGSDSVVAGFLHSGYSWTGGNNTHYTTISALRFSTSARYLQLDSAYRRLPRDNGYYTDVAGVGGDDTRVVALLRGTRVWYYDVSPTVTNAYRAMLVQGAIIRKTWDSIVTAPENDMVALSAGGPLIGMSWLSGGELHFRVLRDSVWCRTSVIRESVSDSQRTGVYCALTPDSTGWIGFGAMKAGKRVPFVARIRPDLTADGLTGVARGIPEPPAPKTVTLDQNYPNPFNPVTHIRFTLADRTSVRLLIYNSIGQQVEVLVDEELVAGEHEVAFDGSAYAGGCYFYRLLTQGHSLTRGFLLLR